MKSNKKSGLQATPVATKRWLEQLEPLESERQKTSHRISARPERLYWQQVPVRPAVFFLIL
jgi:hypothetical protein